MPNLAVYHPQVIHFAIVLTLMGVAFRLISLTGRLSFTKHAASVLLILAAVSGWAAVRSGTDAHGPVERIPGARSAVQEHEELGETAGNWLLVVGALELVALGLAASAGAARYSKFAYAASALVGIGAAGYIYEASEHGGALVYEWAGGPGLRTGNPEDVERLLLAGLYNQSVADRKAGNGAASARLISEMATRFPNDTTVQFLKVESLLLDSQEPAAAIVVARLISIDEKNARYATRKASLLADAFVALGQPDSARAALQPVVTAFPQNTRLKAKLNSIR